MWSMDHTVPPAPVDGTDPAIFSLRDLSSGFQILWSAVADVGAGPVIERLERCFEIHGAPLVLKSDSGSAFTSEAMASFLGDWRVTHLLSPPRWPQYNGAIEASIRWRKVRTEEEASEAGRPGRWTSDDMEKARLGANTAVRRRKGVAQDLWLARSPVDPETREAFAATVRTEELAALKENNFAYNRALTARQRRDVHRDAIRRALVAHGFLCFTRRSVPLPINFTIKDRAG